MAKPVYTEAYEQAFTNCARILKELQPLCDQEKALIEPKKEGYTRAVPYCFESRRAYGKLFRQITLQFQVLQYAFGTMDSEFRDHNKQSCNDEQAPPPKHYIFREGPLVQQVRTIAEPGLRYDTTTINRIMRNAIEWQDVKKYGDFSYMLENGIFYLLWHDAYYGNGGTTKDTAAAHLGNLADRVLSSAPSPIMTSFKQRPNYKKLEGALIEILSRQER